MSTFQWLPCLQEALQGLDVCRQAAQFHDYQSECKAINLIY